MSEDQALPGVKIELGAKEYTILFTLYSFAKLKKVSQLNALKGEVDFLDPQHLLYFLWAGLVCNHPEYDGEVIDGKPDKTLHAALRELGTLLTFDKIPKIGLALRQAFANATAIPNEESSDTQSAGGRKKKSPASLPNGNG